MKKLIKCNLCGNDKFKQVYNLYDKANNIKKYFNLVECKKCGVIFINPQPSFKELKEHYEKNYYSLNEIKTKDFSRKVRLRLFFYNLYFNENNKNNPLRILFLPVKNYFRGTIIKKNLKLLDVGCGSGQFLYEMKNLGLKVNGVEPSDFDEKSSEKYNLNIKKNDLLSAKFPSNSFDLITMNQVLEHVPNPSEIIKEIFRILNKNGTFIVAVPNKRSFAHKIFKKNWYQLDVPRHLFDFSDKILSKELKKAGFKAIKIRHNSRPSQFVISLKRKLNLKTKGKILSILLLPITWIVNLTEQGDSVEIWAKK